MIAAALSAVLLSATPRLEAAASAGGGYDSNPGQVDTTVSSAGAGFALLRASGGASLDLGRSTNVYAGVRFSDDEYPSYSDLTTRAVGLDASLVQELGEHTALVFMPWVAWSWAGDPARDATTLAAQLTLRARPVRDLTLRGTYALTSQDAADPVFSSVRNRLGASIEWRFAPRTYLSLAGSVDHGDQVFYRSVAVGGGGPGMGFRQGSNTLEEPYREMATTWGIGPALEVGLAPGLYALGSYELRWVTSSTTDLFTQSLFFGVGARL